MAGPGAVVVGTGFGCRVHVPALRAAGFEVVALVGRDADRTARRAERAGVPHACGSLPEALALDGVDAVTIATPPHAHAPFALETVAAGKHVLCEKPFALDAIEAATMLAAAERAGVTHLVGHEFRWAEDRATAARALTAGAIGEPRLCTLVQYVPLAADPAIRLPEWWLDRARGGGWLGASGSHVVDQLHVWFGELARVSAVLPIVSARTGVAEDSFVVRFTTRSGVEGVLQQTAASWTPAVVGLTCVAGTNGTLLIDRGEVSVADVGGRRVLPVPDDLRLPPTAVSDDPAHRYTHLELGPYTKLCQVLRAGVDGSPIESPVPVPTFADGLACMHALDAIRASAAAGGAAVTVEG